MGVVIYGSHDTKVRLRHSGYLVMSEEIPVMPSDSTTILVIEDRYETKDGIVVNGLSTLVQFRHERWFGACVLLTYSERYQTQRLWQSLKQDPLVEVVSIDVFKKIYPEPRKLSKLFNDQAYLNHRLDRLYEDLLQSIYGVETFVDNYRHRLLTKINSELRYGLDHCQSLFLSEWPMISRNMRQHYGDKITSTFLKNLRENCLIVDNVDDLIREVNDVFSKLAHVVEYNDVLIEKEDVPPIEILYIRTESEAAQQVVKLLERAAVLIPLKVYTATNPMEARAHLQRYSRIDTIISAYRFWDERNKSHLYNGTILLEDLCRDFGSFNLGFITLKQARYICWPDGVQREDVFSTTALLSRDSKAELQRLLRLIFRGRAGVSGPEYEWPKAIGTGEIRSEIKRLYDGYWLKAPNYLRLQQNIEYNAEQLVEKVQNGDYKEARELCKIGRIQQKKTGKKKALAQLLTARLVVMSLFNYVPLTTQFRNLTKVKSNEKRRRFDIIFNMLFEGQLAYDRPGRDIQKKKNRAKNQFFGFMGILTSKSYFLHQDDIQNIITREESRWLSKIYLQRGKHESYT